MHLTGGMFAWWLRNILYVLVGVFCIPVSTAEEMGLSSLAADLELGPSRT